MKTAAAPRKMQSVHFQTVAELLDFLPDDQRAIVERLRELVFESIPGVEERLSFNVPFFKKNLNICHIWPGAVPWGSKTWAGVELGFSNGNLLADEAQWLDRGGRKQVFSKRFFKISEVPDERVRAYLFEAAELDELLFLEKSQSRRRANRTQI